MGSFANIYITYITNNGFDTYYKPSETMTFYALCVVFNLDT